MYSKNKKKCLIAALHSGQPMPMLEEKQSADVWCQCEVDANWQLYRKSALLSDGLTGRTPKPDILYMFNASDLGAIGRKKKKKNIARHLRLATCLQEKEKCATKKQMGPEMQSRQCIFPVMSTLLMMYCGPASPALNWFPAFLCNSIFFYRDIKQLIKERGSVLYDFAVK